ncbi:tyrosine-type recombinase/integrase [Aquincola sp. S2]|uniref:Tyrosine-type recombinase/integrase n=1 Tax=Pseudaquabacterium terrae TaxID=2732868 RepID=A0ABX2ETH7_9BURK|nr:tyrosine-type recombinase/integrase [Aquabacterium terrae]NRF72045.1 tyrosine-type recombinase/integrase [Aquabacterium terrae]
MRVPRRASDSSRSLPMNQLAATSQASITPASLLGRRPAPQVPIGGVIRPGIKELTHAAQQNDAARAIYERGCTEGKGFDAIEDEIHRAAPNLKNPLKPANVPYFSARRGDFPMPERRLYRFPVIFAADSWEVLMPHTLQVWAAGKRKYWAHFVRYYAYTAHNLHFMEVHARAHEKVRSQPELIAQAEEMVEESIRTATAEVDGLLAKAQKVMADNGVCQSVRYGVGPLLVPAEVVSPHCGSYLALMMKADLLFGMVEYQRLRRCLPGKVCDEQFARVDRLLKSLTTIGDLPINQVHDGTLAPHIKRRLAAGRSHKTVNLELAIVRRVLNLCATSWRDDNGITWLEHAPRITLLPLIGHQREPRPISWQEQRQLLLPKLPPHLARMSLFMLNTGARDDVVCSLRWDWEIKVRELGVSVFEVPATHVKGRRRARVLVCNSVAQSVIEAVRGQHAEFVFVYQRLRKDGTAGREEPHAIETMNNTAWQRARREAGLGDLHVHDLRHTTGMRLREAGVPESTRADILWHTSPSMTHHYSMAQIVELHGALEKIRDDGGCWNKSLATLRLEQEGARRDASPPKVPQQRKTG